MGWSMKKKILYPWRQLVGCSLALCCSFVTVDAREVRFIATGDPQYDNGDNNRKIANRKAWLDIGNRILGGGQTYDCLLIPGDLTQNTRIFDELKTYRNDTQQLIPYLYDTIGNHDEHDATFFQNAACAFLDSSCVSKNRLIDSIRDRLKQKDNGQDRITYLNNNGALVAPNSSPSADRFGAAYSWYEEDVHFISVGCSAIDSDYDGGLGNPGAGEGGGFGNPRDYNTLTFMKNALASMSDKSAPVVIMMHYQLGDFGTPTDKNGGLWNYDHYVAFWEALDGYNIVAVVSGHTHSNSNAVISRPTGATKGPKALLNLITGATFKSSGGNHTEVLINDTELVAQRYQSGMKADLSDLGQRTSVGSPFTRTMVPPTVSISGPSSAPLDIAGNTFQFSSSVQLHGGQSVFIYADYEWDFGDGSPVVKGSYSTHRNVSHTYRSNVPAN